MVISALIPMMVLCTALGAQAAASPSPTVESLDAWLTAPPWTQMLAADWRQAQNLEITPRSSRPAPEALVESARQYLGVPYSWGGVDSNGFDCSGFVNKVYALNGYDLPRTSREQFKVGQEVSRSALQTGDLLFFSDTPARARITHVAMYVDDNEFIHAAYGKGEVTYDQLMARYYADRFVGARRILALPPGHYSNSYGGAKAGHLLASDGKAADDPTGEGTLSLPPEVLAALTGDTANLSPEEAQAAMMQEHREDERPVQIAEGFRKGALTHVGPDLLLRDATLIGVRTGFGHMNNAASWLVAPEFTYFGHGNALRVVIAAPLQIPLSGSQSTADLFKASWKKPADFAKVIREVSFGQKESRLYVDLGRTNSATLGHGQLMRYYTPNMASRYMPHYGLGADALSLSVDASVDSAGFEAFIDDTLSPNVIGVMGYLKPFRLAQSETEFLKGLSFSLTYATDLYAPLRLRSALISPTEAATATTTASTQDIRSLYETQTLHGVSTTAEVKLYRSDSIDLKSYTDGSFLLRNNGTSGGFALGMLLRANSQSARSHVFRLRVEGRISSPTFLPSYFDATYRLSRAHASLAQGDNQALTKLALLDALDGEPSRWSIYSELTYHYVKRLALGIAYEDGSHLQGQATNLVPRNLDRNLMVFFNLRNMYLPNSKRAVSAYAAYHLRSFDSLNPWLGLAKANAYVFVGCALAWNRYLELSGTLRKALDPTQAGGSAAIDGSVDLSLHYEI